MARPPKKPAAKPVSKAKPVKKRRPMLLRAIYWIMRMYLKSLIVAFVLLLFVVGIFKWVNPPITYLMASEYRRLGSIAYVWRDLEDMSPNIPLAIAAAEDANFCAHKGADFDAIKAALADGSGRGASTISQQVAKNVFLWPGRSWIRKGMEAGITMMIEGLWGKRRIMEVYLNVAEFDAGVFGIDAAVDKFFHTSPENLRVSDAARLAMVLPSPRTRSPNNLTGSQRRRVSRISIGATTLRDEHRADCFLPKPSP